MRQYLDLVRRILDEGVEKADRTGVGTIALAGTMFEHDMADGFPLLTTKKMAFKSIRVELEGFLNGITDKKWYQERGCHIWDEWCNPQVVPYGHDAETKQRMAAERDLGPVYGFQWRHWNAAYEGFAADYTGKGLDQLLNLVNTLKRNPDDRRMLVSAWNPEQVHQMALPACHYGYQVTVIDGRLNLAWNQRSVDVMLGLPFNIASYGLLLHLLAKETGLQDGKLVGFLMDTHIYRNQLDGAREQLTRDPRPLPQIVTGHFSSLFDWKHDHTRVEGYNPHLKIPMPVAV